MLSTVRPGNETKILFKDFEKAVVVSGQLNYSAFQLKSVFNLHCENKQEGIDKSFITLRDFKDLFYPHKPWKGDFTTSGPGLTGLMTQQKRKNPADDDDENMSQQSMLIDDIM